MNNFCKDLKEFEGTLEQNEKNEKLMDKYEQIASEGKETLMKFQNKEKSRTRTRARGIKKRKKTRT